MKKSLIIAALTVAISACATGPDPSPAIAEAEKEIKAAKSMNYLWRDTEKVLKQAKAAASDGDNEKANKLAKKAMTQAKLAQKQAKDNSKAKPVYKY